MATDIDASTLDALSAEQVRALPSPAFVFSEPRLRELAEVALRAKETGCQVLYAAKAQAFSDILSVLEPFLDGFSASSLFEATLLRRLWPDALIHLSTPGLRPTEIKEIGALCDFVSVNSLGHLQRHGAALASSCSVGLRVNTGVSSVSDPRYDPARAGSKLGVPLAALTTLDSLELTASVRGLHFHTNADSTKLDQLWANAQALVQNAPLNLRLDWVNLGGGYLFDEIDSLAPLADVVELVHDRFTCDVYIEPGAALVRSAGFIVSEVIDLFEADGTQIAVLDTTVNHAPEVLEFGWQPKITGAVHDGRYEYVVAGSTCLAGDLFGTYRFTAPISIGERLVFEEMGAYTLSKAHRFNGINLPAICALTTQGQIEVRKQFTLENYLHDWIRHD